jgi:hypothetical protein
MPDLLGLTSIYVRPGHPDFLDLPWHLPLSRWGEECDRLVELERGLSRHVVQFVSYAEAIYAFKELSSRGAEHEYQVLRDLEDKRLPAVVPAGHARARVEGGDGARLSVLITRYLDYSQPYRTLFASPGMERYREGMLDAMAELLVQLHLAGFYWGDCSLSNTLFRHDANALQAYLVDAETSEFPERLSDGHRTQDLLILKDNVAGELAELKSQIELPPGVGVGEIAPSIADRYQNLWREIGQIETIAPSEGYRIHERIRKLSDLGFSVSEVELVPTDDGNRLRMRPVVTDREYHIRLLHGLTGIAAGERQAALMLNEIQEVRAMIARESGHEVAMSAAAYRWLHERFNHAIQRLAPLVGRVGAAPDVYCQLLEHKWLISEQAGRDVGLDHAIASYRRHHLGDAEPAATES